MTEAGWAERKMERRDTSEYGDAGKYVHEATVVQMLRKEHARSVRIVKAEIKRVMLDQHEYTDRKKELLLESLNGVLTALQRGRGGKG